MRSLLCFYLGIALVVLFILAPYAIQLHKLAVSLGN